MRTIFGNIKDSYEYHGHRVEIYFFKGEWTIYIDGRDTGEATSGDLRSQRALANLTIDQAEGEESPIDGEEASGQNDEAGRGDSLEE